MDFSQIERNTKATWTILAFVLCLAFALRVAYVLQIGESPFAEPGIGVDTHLYDTWAQRIAQGDRAGDDVFWAAPGYPYFLGAVYSLAGRDLLTARLVQAVLGTLSCLFIFLIARRQFGNLTGLVAAFLASTYQMLIFHDAMLVGSSLSVFLNSLGLYLLTNALAKRRWWGFALSGFVFGAAVLTGVSAILFIFFAAAWLAWRKKAASGMILLLTVFLAILPVTIRNYLVAGDFVPITAHGGINFYIGNNPSATGVYEPPGMMLSSSVGLINDSRTFAVKEAGRDLKPSEISRFWFNKGMDFIKSDPSRFVKLTLRKAALFVNATELTDILNADLSKRFCPVLGLPLVRFGWLFPLAVIGIYASWPLLRENRTLFLFLAGSLVSCCLYFVNARYRLPAVIVLSMFAGYGIVWLMKSVSQRQTIPLLIAVFAGLAAGIVSYWPLHKYDNTVDIYNLALTYQRQARFDEAEKLFLESVMQSPNFDGGYYALGYLCWKQGRREDALAYYKKALAVNPHFAEVMYNLGFMYAQDGKLEAAQEQYVHALSIKPDHVEVLRNLVSVCTRYKVPGKAQACWQKVLEFDPDNIQARQGKSSE